MPRTPDVSVIVPVYNGEGTIERALDSVIGQTLGLARIEVLVVDDGSTDASPGLLDRIAEAHPSIHVFHQPNSGSPAAPRNFALREACGRYVLFLDHDDHIAPSALEAMVGVADRNTTDIVLGRIRGQGGRTTPLTMFQRTIERTDVFSTPRVYWSLSCEKLFRTSTVRRLDLRFAEDLRVYEDQPFVARAYLEGNGLSILADRDYVFQTFREDAGNITTSRVTLQELLPGVERMLDLVADHVEPGPLRDRLVRRHFQNDLLGSNFIAFRTETDPATRDWAFAAFRRLARDYYTPGVDAGFDPRARILMHLIADDDQNRFAAYLDALAASPVRPTVLLEQDRLFVALPWFRDPAAGLPDSVFDITSSLGLAARVDPLEFTDQGLRIMAFMRMGAVTTEVEQIDLVMRERHSGRQASFALAFSIVRDEVDPYARVDSTITSEQLLTLEHDATCDMFFSARAGATRREIRLVDGELPSRARRRRRITLRRTTRHFLLTSNVRGERSIRSLTRIGYARNRLGRLRRKLGRWVRSLQQEGARP